MYECYIGFYDMSKPQGAWGFITKLVSFSSVTHIAPIIKVKNDYITIVLINGGKMRLTKIYNLHKLDVKLLDVLSVGAIDTSVEQLSSDCENYSNATAWKVFWWYFITRWFTHGHPKVCTTYTCDLFKLPYQDRQTRVLPASLYRRLKNDSNYDRWQSPCWENNRS